MPRRKLPYLGKYCTVTGDALSNIEKRKVIAALKRSATSIPSSKLRRLVKELFDALGYAKLPMKPLLAGKSSKPDAWRLDIFARDFRKAWANAGLPSTVR